MKYLIIFIIQLVAFAISANARDAGLYCSKNDDFIKNSSVMESKSIVDKYECTSKVNYWLDGKDMFNMALTDLSNFFETCSCVTDFHEISSERLLSKNIPGSDIAHIIGKKHNKELKDEFGIYQKLSTVGAVQNFFDTNDYCEDLIESVNDVDGCSDIIDYEAPDFFDMIKRLSDEKPLFSDDLKDLASRVAFNYFKEVTPLLEKYINKVDKSLRKEKYISVNQQEEKRNTMIERYLVKLSNSAIDNAESSYGSEWSMAPKEKKHIISNILMNDVFRNEMIKRFTKNKKWYLAVNFKNVEDDDEKYSFIRKMFKRKKSEVKDLCSNAEKEIKNYCKYKVRASYKEDNSYYNAVSCELLKRNVQSKYANCDSENRKNSSDCKEFEQYINMSIDDAKRNGGHADAEKRVDSIHENMKKLMGAKSFATDEQVKYAKNKLLFEKSFGDADKKRQQYNEARHFDKQIVKKTIEHQEDKIGARKNSNFQVLGGSSLGAPTSSSFKDSSSSVAGTSPSISGVKANSAIGARVYGNMGTSGQSSFFSPSTVSSASVKNSVVNNKKSYADNVNNTISSKELEIERLMEKVRSKENALSQKESAGLRSEINRLKSTIENIKNDSSGSSRPNNIASTDKVERTKNDIVDNVRYGGSLNPAANTSSTGTFSSKGSGEARTAAPNRQGSESSSSSGASYSSSSRGNASSGGASRGSSNSNQSGDFQRLSLSIPENAKVFTFEEFNSPDFQPDGQFFYVKVNGKLEKWEINPKSKSKKDKYVKVQIIDQSKSKKKLKMKNDSALAKSKENKKKNNSTDGTVKRPVSSHQNLVDLLNETK